VNIIKLFMNDPHPYVRQMSTISLLSFLNIRFLRVDKKYIFTKKQSNQLEDMAFDILEKTENWKLNSVMESILYLFGGFRALNTSEAKKVTNIFVNEVNEKIIVRFVFLLIYYAEFRKESFGNWDFDEMKKLGKFDSSFFKKKLLDLIRRNDIYINEEISSQFSRLKRNYTESNYYERFGEYLNLLLKFFDERISWKFQNLLKQDFEEQEDLEGAYKFWVKFINAEKNYLESTSLDYYQNTANWRILESIYNRLGEEKFLNGFDTLINYKKENLAQFDEFKECLEILENIKGKNKKKAMVLLKHNGITSFIRDNEKESRKKTI
ncbi:MAG: hypothetical protein KKF65_05665, partial [Nanoarchaeota archaeon]|nr:hypothetical protein [Nanoarchaeota archaeon]